MTKGRLEAFSDAVIAIVLTIMVLELPSPEGSSLASLSPVAPKLLTYALSFVFLGIYWSNHHHLFQAVQRVNGAALWANLHLLFWLSLIPFVTGWAGDHSATSLPVALYGVVLIFAAMAYFILVRTLLAQHAGDSPLAAAIGRDTKGKTSLGLYAVAIPSSFLNPVVAWALYLAVALMWLVPDRRIERRLAR
ncbi:MAG: TMEM175 family protein [Anaerolineales bacterium]